MPFLFLFLLLLLLLLVLVLQVFFCKSCLQWLANLPSPREGKNEKTNKQMNEKLLDNNI